MTPSQRTYNHLNEQQARCERLATRAHHATCPDDVPLRRLTYTGGNRSSEPACDARYG